MKVVHQLGKHVLGQEHEVVVIRVGHVELARGEFRVVRGIDLLVAELLTNLVYAVEATHHQLLEEQLRRDPQVQVLLEVVVVRHERLSGGAARDGIHHGCLHLQEAQVVEVVAYKRDDAAAGDKDLAHAGMVHQQVQVSLPVAHLWVLDALQREHPEAGGEDRNLNGQDGKLAGVALPLGVGTGRVALNPDYIPRPQKLVEEIESLLVPVRP
mmetsp:Transcript_14884/g.42339  ORF Transcript_14884/g.42339 Transcript_14884/m.42339 type:complete len:212 (-) Transcript_14884:492-1127(-)